MKQRGPGCDLIELVCHSNTRYIGYRYRDTVPQCKLSYKGGLYLCEEPSSPQTGPAASTKLSLKMVLE